MSSRASLGPLPDTAVQGARAVVGLYGDPDAYWAIVIELDLAELVDVSAVSKRWSALSEAHPHLGRLGTVRRFSPSEHVSVLNDFANRAYADHESLVRVGLSRDARTLVLGAHHGVLDGYGMLGVASLLLNFPVGTSARGVSTGDADVRPGFVRGHLRRLGEAILCPPERFATGPRNCGIGDWLRVIEVEPRPEMTAALVWAVTRTLRRWNGAQEGFRQPVVALGLSRRPGTPPLAPTRDNAYARIKTRTARTRADVQSLLERMDTEPDFPASQGRWAPMLTRLISSRLGSTALVSNLGIILDSSVVGARVWGTPAGRAGVAFGLFTAGRRTSLTLRARRSWFTETETEHMLQMVAAELADQ